MTSEWASILCRFHGLSAHCAVGHLVLNAVISCNFSLQSRFADDRVNGRRHNGRVDIRRVPRLRRDSRGCFVVATACRRRSSPAQGLLSPPFRVGSASRQRRPSPDGLLRPRLAPVSKHLARLHQDLRQAGRLPRPHGTSEHWVRWIIVIMCATMDELVNGRASGRNG